MNFLDGAKTHVIMAVVILLAVVEGVLGFDVPGVEIPDGDWLSYALGALGVSSLRDALRKIGL